jgi:uncharacterized protein (DUF885 family)
VSIAGLLPPPRGLQAGVHSGGRLRDSLALQRAQTLVADGVRPAFERALALLNELHPRTTNDAGLWRLPGGDRAYAQALAANTTTKMTAEEIHTVGLREVARIEGEMDRVLKTLGRSQGSVRERMAALRAELQPPASPDPRPMLLARYADYVREAQERAAPLFNITPRAPVLVQRVPALTERTATTRPLRPSVRMSMRPLPPRLCARVYPSSLCTRYSFMGVRLP